ncbi:hypothetical protein ACVWZL_009078 [Bradyrhizobium sp. GM2.4]
MLFAQLTLIVVTSASRDEGRFEAHFASHAAYFL